MTWLESPNPTKPQVPRDDALKLALRMIEDAGASRRDILGSKRSRFREHTELRHSILRAVHRKWPRASFASIARTFEMDHTTVLSALGRRKSRYRPVSRRSQQ